MTSLPETSITDALRQRLTGVSPPGDGQQEELNMFIQVECMRMATAITKTQTGIQEHVNEIRNLHDIIKQREDQVTQLRGRIVHLQGSVAAYRSIENKISETSTAAAASATSTGEAAQQELAIEDGDANA